MLGVDIVNPFCYSCDMIDLTPTIAALIPVYNEEPVIKGTIDALVEAGMPLKDIYVVNDRSTDRTESIALSLGVNVYTVPENGGKAIAQRRALDYFGLTKKYDWVVFLDGDTKVDVDFIKAFRNAAIAEPDVGLFVGQVKSVRNSHIFSASRSYEYTYGQDVAKHGQSNFGVVLVSPGCSSMYNSKTLEKLDIDHNTLAEDMDLTMQVHQSRGKIKYVPTAIVYTQDPASLVDYNKQILRWFRGLWQVVKKHRIFNPLNNLRVNWYMRLVILDALILNPVFWIPVLLFISPYLALVGFIGNFFISSLIAIYSGFRTRRFDVVYKFPVYYWISYINLYAFVRAFVEIIILRKELLTWNKVKRYNFDSHIT